MSVAHSPKEALSHYWRRGEWHPARGHNASHTHYHYTHTHTLNSQPHSSELSEKISMLQAFIAEINSSMASELARVKLEIGEAREMIASYRASRAVV